MLIHVGFLGRLRPDGKQRSVGLVEHLEMIVVPIADEFPFQLRREDDVVGLADEDVLGVVVILGPGERRGDLPCMLALCDRLDGQRAKNDQCGRGEEEMLTHG